MIGSKRPTVIHDTRHLFISSFLCYFFVFEFECYTAQWHCVTRRSGLLRRVGHMNIKQREMDVICKT